MNIKNKIFLLTCGLIPAVVLIFMSFSQGSDRYVGSGTVSFTSSAPLETIKASSGELKGLIDLSNNGFAFSLPVSTFEGFNSTLQKEHFNENYMETSIYTKSTFTGKMLGFTPCKDKTPCEMEVTAKGKLNIHGITKVVTIPVTISMKKNDLKITSDFEVLLADYGIEIPLILKGKISPAINVSVNASFARQNE